MAMDLEGYTNEAGGMSWFSGAVAWIDVFLF